MTPIPSIFKRVKKEENFPIGLELKFNDKYADDNRNAIFTGYMNVLKTTRIALQSVLNLLNQKRELNHNSEIFIAEVGNVKLTDCIYMGLVHGREITEHYCKLIDPLIQEVQKKIDEITQIIDLEELIIQQT